MAAPTGGSGAGNTVGSGGTAGVGTGLNYVGEHAFAYSGTVPLEPNAFTRMLRFNMGQQYLVGTFQLEGDFTQLGNDQIKYKVLINDEPILDTDYSPSNDAQYADSPTPILLPPYSSVEITATHNQGGVDINFQAMVIGRVYA